MKRKSGIIFRAPRLPFRFKPFFLKKWLALLGNIFLLISFFGLIFTFSPLLIVRIKYFLTKNLVRRIYFGDLLKKEISPTILAPDPYFSLVIPKINARAKIVANVDASNPKEYLWVLKQGVAHAKGTGFPGISRSIFLFAHSTDAPWNVVRYNAVFYLLHELEIGDEIVIFFYNKKYFYRVFEKKIVSRQETDFWKKKDEEVLILQTCWPPGTTQKALLVFGKRP